MLWYVAECRLTLLYVALCCRTATTVIRVFWFKKVAKKSYIATGWRYHDGDTELRLCWLCRFMIVDNVKRLGCSRANCLRWECRECGEHAESTNRKHTQRTRWVEHTERIHRENIHRANTPSKYTESIENSVSRLWVAIRWIVSTRWCRWHVQLAPLAY